MIASPSPDPDLRLVNHQTQPNVIIIITIKQTKSFRSNFKLTIFINGFPFNRGSYFIRFSLSVPHRIVDCWQEPGPVRGQPRNFSASTSRILMRWLATLLTSPGNQQSPSSRILDSAANNPSVLNNHREDPYWGPISRLLTVFRLLFSIVWKR